MMICVEFLTLSWQKKGLSIQINALDRNRACEFFYVLFSIIRKVLDGH